MSIASDAVLLSIEFGYVNACRLVSFFEHSPQLSHRNSIVLSIVQCEVANLKQLEHASDDTLTRRYTHGK